MAPSLTDLKKLFFGATAQQSVSDAEYAFMSAANAAGITGSEQVRTGGGKAPIRTVSTVDYPLLNTGVGWSDAFHTEGSAAARPMDIVIPNVKAGDWIEIEASGIWSNEAIGASLRMATIVAGATVNPFPNPANEVKATWAPISGVLTLISGSVPYQLVQGDIENGSVRVRAQYNKNSATAKTLYGAALGFRFTLIGRGPFR